MASLFLHNLYSQQTFQVYVNRLKIFLKFKKLYEHSDLIEKKKIQDSKNLTYRSKSLMFFEIVDLLI